MTTPRERLREALKQDFNNLYVKQFTTDWQTQRLVRQTEIDIMALENLDRAINRYLDEVMQEVVPEPYYENDPKNAKIHIPYMVGFNQAIDQIWERYRELKSK